MEATLGGYAWLPRMIDKARAAQAGTQGTYSHPCPVDHTLLARMGVSPTVFGELLARSASDEEILIGLRELGAASPEEAWFDPVAVEDDLMAGGSFARVVNAEDLPFSVIAREFVGEDHGSGLTILMVEAPPGAGPRLHEHPYEELIITLEGEADFRIGKARRVVRAGEIAVVKPNTPHAFVNSGSSALRQIDIHLSPCFDTRWLERS